MNDPVFAVLLVLHILVAVIGFGAIGATGIFAARAARLADPHRDAAIRRYFQSGRNLAERAVLLVPLFGAALLGIGDPADRRAAWPWIGLGLWVVAMGLASARLWPAERALQLAFSAEPQPQPESLIAIRRAGRSAETAAGLVSICFAAALVVMIAQPA